MTFRRTGKWLKLCIVAAFSLRELRRVRYWFTQWGSPDRPRRGRGLPIVDSWEGHIQLAAIWLYIMGLAWLQGNSSLFISMLPSSSDATQDESCAASLDALWVIHRVLMGMDLVGMALLSICIALFPYWHDELDAMGGALVAATPAGQRKIAGRARLIGVLSLLGKNLLHPVLPGLLMSQALLGYRCIGPFWGLVHIIISTPFSVLMYGLLIVGNSPDLILRMSDIHDFDFL